MCRALITQGHMARYRQSQRLRQASGGIIKLKLGAWMVGNHEGKLPVTLSWQKSHVLSGFKHSTYEMIQTFL